METFKKKDWQEFLDGRLAVNCPTEELANEFVFSEKLKEIHTWRDHTYWNESKDQTCYTMKYGFSYSYRTWFVTNGFPIKEFKGWDAFNFNAEELKKRFIELRLEMQQRANNLKQKDWVDRVQKFTSLMIELRNPNLSQEEKYEIEAEICYMFMIEHK